MYQLSDVVILVPTYNERDNIGLTLDRVAKVSQELRVIVIDDSSPDGTAEIVRHMVRMYPSMELLLRTEDKGFAKAYLAGFRKALEDESAKVVLMMDADFSHDPEEIPGMLARLNERADVVTGSRYAVRQEFKDITLWRRVLSRFANVYVKMVLGLPLTDCTSGFVMMRREVLQKLPMTDVRTEGYGFLFQLKYRAWKQGFKIVEHPVRWPERHQGKSKMTVKRMFESARLPWLIRFG
ncbi:MAG: polyprenol monophosphomannose synthase [Patescibacteria group bacterium]